MTTTTQTRLPRQFAAPEGPVDMTMMYVMHHAFRRDFEAFASAVPRTPVDDASAWQALRDRWALLSEVLHHHHRGEDTWLWPALLERAEEADRETLLAMEAEHEDIDPMLALCAAGFEAMAAHPAEDTRNALAVRLVAARESLGRHLEHEEGEAIAILQRVLTHAEWEAIDEHFKEGVSFRQVLRLVPWALHELPQETRAVLFAEPGGAVHKLMWRLTRGRFERLNRRAFAHL